MLIDKGVVVGKKKNLFLDFSGTEVQVMNVLET